MSVEAWQLWMAGSLLAAAAAGFLYWTTRERRDD